MPKSVCVNCEVELKPEENGIVVAEMFQENTKIYKLWYADLWKCPLCDYKIILGFGNNPFMEHFQGDCESRVDELLLEGKTIIYDKEVK